MRKAQQGDHVQVHYVKRFQDGSTVTSRDSSPLEVTIGTTHPRLPGLGLTLVGLAAGECRTLRLPPEQAYGLRDPGRVRTVHRKLFPPDKPLPVGKWVRILGRRGPRLVRILEWCDERVVIDVNHRRAGQALELEVELIAILNTGGGPDASNLSGDDPANQAGGTDGAQQPTARSATTDEPGPAQSRAIAFDVDPETLSTLRQAFPEWQIEVSNRAMIDSLIAGCSLGTVDLMVLGVRDKAAETLGLCRVLRKQAGSVQTPLLIVVPPGEEDLTRGALDAGATSCLVLPVHAKELASMVIRAQEGNRPGRHTLNLNRAQEQDRWRDDGGQG
jgi:FKBP-type peptidyl-prolyl cis-trans isomerase 2